MPYCPKCGIQLIARDKFCRECGIAIENNEAAIENNEGNEFSNEKIVPLDEAQNNSSDHLKETYKGYRREKLRKRNIESLRQKASDKSYKKQSESDRSYNKQRDTNYGFDSYVKDQKPDSNFKVLVEMLMGLVMGLVLVFVLDKLGLTFSIFDVISAFILANYPIVIAAIFIWLVVANVRKE